MSERVKLDSSTIVLLLGIAVSLLIVAAVPMIFAVKSIQSKTEEVNESLSTLPQAALKCDECEECPEIPEPAPVMVYVNTKEPCTLWQYKCVDPGKQFVDNLYEAPMGWEPFSYSTNSTNCQLQLRRCVAVKNIDLPAEVP